MDAPSTPDLHGFTRGLIRVPDRFTGALVAPTLHVGQREVFDAIEARDPATGGRRHPIIFLDWARKCAKDFTFMVVVLFHLAFDPYEKEPRFAAIAAWDAEQTQISRRTAEQIIDRHPWLRAHFRVLRNTIIFTEDVREPRTGGTYQIEHIAEFLSRDTKGTHGLSISLKCHNEFWCDTNYDFEEALVVSPSRRSPLTIFASYHGLRQDERDGVPLHDLRTRIRNGDPRVFHSFIGGEGDRAAEKLVPWRTVEWLDEQRTLFAHAPNRFRRMVLNLPAGPDAGLVTFAELQAARRPLREPLAGTPGVQYLCVVDLGVRFDWSVVMIAHVDGDGCLCVDAIRTWRPTPDKAVSLLDVAEELRQLYRRFRWTTPARFDQFQSHPIIELLARDHIPAEVVDVTSAIQDRLVSGLKAAFARRAVAIPDDATDLLEQLESVQAIETRRGLKLREGASSNDARGHDDLAFSLATLIEMAGPELGKATLPQMTGCYRAMSIGRPVPCYLLADYGSYIPSGCPSCTACEPHQHVLSMWRTDSRGASLREFRVLYVGDNKFTKHSRESQGWAQLRREMEDAYGL